jgi:oxygen-independent coproporphyrinogen-3 oxidase
MQEERAMLELRLRNGLSLDVVKGLNQNHAKAISELVASKLIDGKAALQGQAVLTLQGRLLADFVLRKLLGL